MPREKPPQIKIELLKKTFKDQVFYSLGKNLNLSVFYSMRGKGIRPLVCRSQLKVIVPLNGIN